GFVVADDRRHLVFAQAGVDIDVEVLREDLEALVGQRVTHENSGAAVLRCRHAPDHTTERSGEPVTAATNSAGILRGRPERSVNAAVTSRVAIGSPLRVNR